MRKRFRAGGFVIAVCLSALFSVPAAWANGFDEELVPLTGETLITSEAGAPGTSQVDGTCNPLGTSTFTFTVTGVAVGPFPGTFVETGTFTLGPVGFPIESFEATFTITSPAGTVSGTKTLAGATSIGSGVCGAFAFGGTEAEAVDLQTGVRYSAQITTPGGTATDSGDSVVNYDETQLRGEAAQSNGFSFTENFTSTSFVPGENDDDDDDDQGEDDDDQGEDDDDQGEDDDDQGEDEN
jgi:hypothetical protein